MIPEHAAIGTIEIPGEQLLSRTIVPDALIALPLRAVPRRGKNIASAILTLPIGLLCLFGTCVLPLAALGGNFGISDFLLLVLVWPFFAAGALGFTGIALTCLCDSMRKAPVLQIDAEAFTDIRSGTTMKWTEVTRATMLFTRSGIASVDLNLREPSTARQNPFRIGVLGFRWRHRPDRLIVSVAFLNLSAHVLAFTILELTQRAGGETVTKTRPWDISQTTPTRYNKQFV